MRLVFILCLFLTSCVLVPNSVRPELAHYSHITQHAPFTQATTYYAADWASVILHWDIPHNFYIEIGDGISLDKHYPQYGTWGEVAGPREEFSARAGYIFEVKK